MKIYRSFSEAPANEKISLIIGNFDGIHAGHREIIRVAKSCSAGCKTALLTFDPHPRQVLNPDFAPLMITSCAERNTLLSNLGIERLFIIPFHEIKEMSAVVFLNYLHEHLALDSISVGFNFYFGRNQEGNPDILLWWSKATSVTINIVPAVIREGLRVSSSTIREFILGGEIDKAASFLQFPYVISGEVSRGRQIGSQIGFPTFNVMPPQKIMPPDGVYVTASVINGKTMHSVTNIGTNPTIDAEGCQRTIETHVLDDRLPDLYGKKLAVYFMKRLRGEIRFSSREKLIEKIARDIEDARRFWQSHQIADLPDMSNGC